MNVEEIKADRERIIELRKEDWNLKRKIENAVFDEKKRSAGNIWRYEYGHDGTKIPIINIHTKKLAYVTVPFLLSHGYKEYEKYRDAINDTMRKMEMAICVSERERRKEIDKEIEEFYEKYKYLWETLEYQPCEGHRYDGENEFIDLLMVAIIVLEKSEQ